MAKLLLRNFSVYTDCIATDFVSLFKSLIYTKFAHDDKVQAADTICYCLIYQ